MREIIKRIQNRRRTARFPLALKQFARALHFHSPAAYDFVRRSFFKCLPTVQTMNSWICSKQCEPGISEETINNISEIVEQEKKRTNKKLVFNLVFDEMSTQKFDEWDKHRHAWKGFVDSGGQVEEVT